MRLDPAIGCRKQCIQGADQPTRDPPRDRRQAARPLATRRPRAQTDRGGKARVRVPLLRYWHRACFRGHERASAAAALRGGRQDRLVPLTSWPLRRALRSAQSN